MIKGLHVKKVLAGLFALICTLTLFLAFAGAPDVSAKGAILIEAQSGRVLFQKNADKKLPMASTTKIMTAILAIENGDFKQEITTDAKAYGVEGSSIYIEKNEKISLENLLYGLMLKSGNDAAVAIAIHIGGSIEKFVELMNQKAKSLGANNTNFVNPNGLPNDNHYTTVSDYAKITAYAMKNPIFRQIVSTKDKVIPWAGHEWNRSLKNSNKLLFSYEGAIGVKTGYTKAAGKCLVFAANRGDVEVISVVFGSNDMYSDCSTMADYGFSQLQRVQLAKKDEVIGLSNVKNSIRNVLEMSLKDDIVISIRQNEIPTVAKKVTIIDDLNAPIEKGSILGKVEFFLDDILLGSSDVVASCDMPQATFRFYFDGIVKSFLEGSWVNKE